MANYGVGAYIMNVGKQSCKTTYHGLDGLRGVAAVLVVIYHSALLFGHQLAPSGYLAVDLFFLLSGFVISHSYDNRLGSGLSVGRFAVIRFVRLWPLYTLGLLIGVSYEILLLLTSNDFAMPVGSITLCLSLSVFLIPTLFHTRFDALYPFNGPSWSVFFEFIVNVIYALSFRYLTRRILLTLVLISAIWLMINAVEFGSVDWGHKTNTILGGLVRTIFFFQLECFCTDQIGVT